jgi:hypothetical protein
MKRLRFVVPFLAPALLVFAAQAGAARQGASSIQKTAAPVWTLAMDGPRVAYASGGRIRVWNVVTGATSIVKGSSGRAAEVAIAGKRVAWIRRQWIGNTEASERLYTASLGGRARLVAHSYRYDRDDPSAIHGGWISGAVGSGNVLAVSTWKSDGTIASDERLSRITPAGLRSIVTGPGTVAAESANGNHIAVLRSTSAWPNDTHMPISAAPTVGIYSTGGALLHEIPLGPSEPGTVGIGISLSGSRLVVMTTGLQDEPSSVVLLRVYDWTTGELLDTWPVAITSDAGEVSFSVHGRLAAVEGPSRLHLVDLASGTDVMIARASHTSSPPALGPHGLVYVTRSSLHGPGKLVFVPMAKLSALVG